MRFAVALSSSCLLLLLCVVTGGCTRFQGEWLEEGTIKKDGTFVPADGDRRQAIRFDWPATVRSGAYADLAGVVDDQTVQWDQYWTMKNDHVAQSGAASAHIEDGKLIVVVDGDVRLRFTKVKGDSIFPPAVKFPSLSAQ